jgi:PAS domain S-box-containing protein
MSNNSQLENAGIEILIVDDSPTQAEHLKYKMEKHNFITFTAGNGEEALEMMHKHKPSVVISDIVMPRMDGYELCRQIKADTRFKDIPVVLLTSLTDSKDVMRSLECGADNFVHKSCNEDYLFNLINRLLVDERHDNNMQTPAGIHIDFAGQEYFITSSRMQVITLLLSTYETAVQKNNELREVQNELRELNSYLEQKIEERTVALRLEIEERKQAEEKLRLAAEEWKTTFDSISDWISIHGKDFRIIKGNKPFVNFLKMTPQEIAGKHCYELIHGDNNPICNCPLVEVLETKRPAWREFYNSYLEIHMEVFCFPILDDENEIVSVVHLSRDITERKKMQEQLILTDRLASIGQLTSGVAHEINNPLTSVIGFSEMLLSRELPENIKEDVITINSEAQRVAQIVKGLLAFSRKTSAQKTQVNVIDIINTVLQLRRYEHRMNNIAVNKEIAQNLPFITGNASQIQQVFVNIIINAEHAMAEAHGKGTLTIAAKQIEDYVKISFIDDGSGISPENMDKLFTPFFTTKDSGKGTGLGLSICHGIILDHRGKIYAQSQLGAGTAFIIELPVAKQTDT